MVIHICYHSEKLTVVFGLIAAASGALPFQESVGQQQHTYTNSGQQGQGTSQATQPGEINVALLGKEQLPPSHWRTSPKPGNASGEGKL